MQIATVSITVEFEVSVKREGHVWVVTDILTHEDVPEVGDFLYPGEHPGLEIDDDPEG